MLEDQRATRRVTERPQTGSCIHCHASTTVLYRKAGLAKGAPGSLAAAFGSPEAQVQLMTGFEAVCLSANAPGVAKRRKRPDT